MKKLWLYLAPRPFSEDEEVYIQQQSAFFLNSWNNHGNVLSGKIFIIEHQILALIADENVYPVSGCSIDKSVNFVKDLSSNLNIDMLDRSLIIFKKDGENKITNLKEVKALISQNVISPETWVFNLQLTDADNIDKQLLVQAKETWLKRYFELVHSV